MKKLTVIIAFSIMLVIVTGAFADGVGATKMQLTDREGNVDGPGWAIANITPACVLILEIHLESGEECIYDVWVKINGVNLTWPGDPSGILTTNRTGLGNAHVVVELAECEGESFEVTVVVKKPEHKPTDTKGFVGSADVSLK